MKDGIVTLAGHVPSYAERYAAEQAAKRVYGVKAVANDIEVKLPGRASGATTDIAAAAVAALRANIVVPAEQIKVTVSKGWVTLEGRSSGSSRRRRPSTPSVICPACWG